MNLIEYCWQFSGSFKNDLKNGYGNEFLQDGSEYLGEYYNGIKEGRGVLSIPNGDKYDGEFKNDQCHGSGKSDYIFL